MLSQWGWSHKISKIEDLFKYIFLLALNSQSIQQYKKAPIYYFSTTTRVLNSNKNSFALKISFSQIFQECSKQKRSANVGQQAHAHMITSGFVPTIFVSNCLIHMYIKCSNLDYAHKVFDRIPEPDTISWNAMIFGYSSCGMMPIALSLFNIMPAAKRDVVSWNSLISGYLLNEQARASVDLFLEMVGISVRPDRTTFAVVLKLSSAFEDYNLGIQIHCLTIHMGFDVDVVTGSALVDMYAKCRRLEDAREFFDNMPQRNGVSWSAIIAGYAQNDCFVGGLQLFKEMQRAGVAVSQSIYATVFRSCAAVLLLELGHQIHGHAIKSDYGLDAIVGTAVLDMYAKCDALDDARKVFGLVPKHNLQPWNAMIVGNTRKDQGFETLQLLHALLSFDIGFDEITLSGAFSACAGIEGYLEGIQVHVLAIKKGLEYNICVANAILDMYGKCGGLAEAQRVFNEMGKRDAVSWNAILATYEQNGFYEETLSHLCQMLHFRLKPDEFSYGSVIKACAGLQSYGCGAEVHGLVMKSGLGYDPFVASALVDMYSKCGAMADAEKLHERLESETVVSWNAIISGFSSQKQSELAQMFFSRMLDMGLKPDNFTYATILDTCANLATIGFGKQIHAQIIKQDLQRDVYVSSTLVDMYSKCGIMNDSQLMFDKLLQRDIVSWNTLICGYGQHGLGLEALNIFERMRIENVKPTHATFIAVLRACGFMGLFDEGICYFNMMIHEYRLSPQLEHYSCIVDIVGRSGQVDNALKLIYGMPFEPDAIIWRTLLSACKTHGNVEVAGQAAEAILRLDPQDSAAYVLLSNVYAEAGRWDEVSRIRKLMRQNRLKKEPGCSWIEVRSLVNTFLVCDKAHPRCQEIYERLDELIGEMKMVGYVPDVEFCPSDDEIDLAI